MRHLSPLIWSFWLPLRLFWELLIAGGVLPPRLTTFTAQLSSGSFLLQRIRAVMANADTPTKIMDDVRPAKTEQSVPDLQQELTCSL